LQAVTHRTEVAEGVHRLGTEWVNWYLVDDGGLTVVDSGFPRYFEQLRALLASMGRALADVDAVVLTHYHSDHMGSAERIRKEGGATVYAPEGDAAGVRGDAKVPLPKGLMSNIWRPMMLRYVRHALANGGAKAAPVGEVRTYADGDVLDVPGRLRVIHTPDHTGGHCSLVHDGRGVLLAGDALATMSVTSDRMGAQLPPADEDAAQARASLSRLEGVAAEILLCGHGEPYRGTIAGAMEQARS
jgi:glyoxylase-like metal-dependent hydrolase (beta-lactamase superfamily II)